MQYIYISNHYIVYLKFYTDMCQLYLNKAGKKKFSRRLKWDNLCHDLSPVPKCTQRILVSFILRSESTLSKDKRYVSFLFVAVRVLARVSYTNRYSIKSVEKSEERERPGFHPKTTPDLVWETELA